MIVEKIVVCGPESKSNQQPKMDIKISSHVRQMRSVALADFRHTKCIVLAGSNPNLDIGR